MQVGLIFSGQGAQTIGMGQSLAEQSAAARSCYERADAILGWSISEVSFHGPDEALTETKVCQPALFVVGIAAVEAAREAGKLPAVGACLGLSLGEITALTAAGAFDFETGLKVVAERGRLMQEACEASSGTMASIIGAPEDTVRALCAEFDVDLANLNCPGQLVVSGAAENVGGLVAVAKERGAKMAVPLNVAGAYHSRLMEPAREAFAAFLDGVAIRAPEVPVFTNVTGGQVSDSSAIRGYLVDQVVSSVYWEQCMRSAAALGIDTFLECGPGKVLAGMARRTDKSWTVLKLAEWEDIAQLAVA